MFTIERTVAAELVERQYRHVHHADSLRLLEECRLEWIAGRGFPNEELIARDCFLVIASLAVQYKRELLENDALVISCESCRVEGKSIFIQQEIRKRSDGVNRQKVAIAAEVELKCMSGRTKRALEPPSDLLVALASEAK